MIFKEAVSAVQLMVEAHVERELKNLLGGISTWIDWSALSVYRFEIADSAAYDITVVKALGMWLSDIYEGNKDRNDNDDGDSQGCYDNLSKVEGIDNMLEQAILSRLVFEYMQNGSYWQQLEVNYCWSDIETYSREQVKPKHIKVGILN